MNKNNNFATDWKPQRQVNEDWCAVAKLLEMFRNGKINL